MPDEVSQTPGGPGGGSDEVIQVGGHSYVLALSTRVDERTRVLKSGETFCVFDRQSDIVRTGMGDQGLYHDGMRHLSRLDLLIDGRRPLLLSSGLEEDELVLVADLTNPDKSEAGVVAMARGTVHIFRSSILWEGWLHQRFQLHNYGTQAVDLDIVIRAEADFSDMFEVRGVRRTRRGTLVPPRFQDGAIIAEYAGLDGVRRSTLIRCDPLPRGATSDRLDVGTRLSPGESRSIDLHVHCNDGRSTAPCEVSGGGSFDDALGCSKSRLKSLADGSCDITTSSEDFNNWLSRSRSDLHLMTTQTQYGPYPYAGIPWFSTPFGRDGAITALQTLWAEPSIARGVLSFLAATQADKVDPASDAEPGKIMHEFRLGEMAAIGEVPYARYYGSADSTPLFIMLAGEYIRTSGDMEFAAALWPNIERALNWIDRFGDRDGDGFVEYQAAASTGLTNQGWKDSGDSVFYEDGSLVQPPVALCEVQGYVYAAKQAAAEIARLLGNPEGAATLERHAAALRDRFIERFWDRTLGCYAIALDGAKRPCRVATSNQGHCLWTGIAADEHAHQIVRDLLSPRFSSGWGIRTLGADQPRYNPMSYHNGSIWPHDTAIAAAGMARYGDWGACARVMGTMLDISVVSDLHRMPELYCGFPRRRGEAPVRYPVACSPQSWAAGSVYMLLQACLGLSVRALRREIVFTNPTLPEFLQVVTLRNLRVGPTTADLVIQRHGDDVGVNILRREGGVRVTVTK